MHRGDIIDGKGERETIGGESYRALVRKAGAGQGHQEDRKPHQIPAAAPPAPVIENLWREITLPISRQNAAARDRELRSSFCSGSYYLYHCNALAGSLKTAFPSGVVSRRIHPHPQ